MHSGRWAKVTRSLGPKDLVDDGLSCPRCNGVFVVYPELLLYGYLLLRKRRPPGQLRFSTAVSREKAHSRDESL